MKKGDWLGAQTSILSPFTRAVAFIGSMQACATCSVVNSALIVFAAPAIAALASPSLMKSTPLASSRLRARAAYSAMILSELYERALAPVDHSTLRRPFAFFAA